MGNSPTALRGAIRADDVTRVRTLLEKAGTNAASLINEDHSQDCVMQSCSPVQGNAFYYAVARNRTQITEVMLKYGADFYSTGLYGEACLHCASRHNNVQIARMLVQAGADPYVTDDQGGYPIHSAAMSIYDTTNIITVLVKEIGDEEDVNLRDFAGRSALHVAAMYGNVGATAILLSLGSDDKAKSQSGQTPLDCAKNYPGVMKLLNEHRSKKKDAQQTSNDDNLNDSDKVNVTLPAQTSSMEI